ncbi:methyl-accepting chemotaxis protein [Lysinibacillus sp. FSL H8-0500]|uniref:methyl-accepting chemotaxis protein n=1 Tax=Lysinibacillus sp. FSL H8-0500 TaxID=2921393 RepID=UPI0031010376
MKITAKVSIVSAIILILIITILTFNSTINIQKVISQLESSETKNISIGLNNEIKNQFDLLSIGNTPIINNQEILKAFANRDRETLANLTLPLMKQLEEQGVKQFQFHLPNATSFFRVHSPEEFGDDLSSFRHTVVKANNEQTIVEGLEGGVAGVGFRYVVPLSYNGSSIGTVELGMGITEGLLEKFQENYSGNWTLYAIENESSQFMLSTGKEKESSIPKENINKLLNGEEIEYLDNTTKILAFPLTDFSGKVKWYLESEIDYTAMITQKNSYLYTILLAGIIISIIGLAIVFLFLRQILKPLSIISSDVEQIADGNLTIEPKTYTTKDEIGILSSSFHKMTSNLKALILGIQQKAQELSQNATSISHNALESKEETNEIVRSITSINDNTQQVKVACEETAKAVTEISRGIVRVADNTANIAEATNTMNDVTTQGSSSVQSAIGQMEAIQQHSIQFANIIGELKVDSDEIGQIMQLITGIAEQTNLLALNAAIEAARAGEAGKGFAVVADEIRKLADQTSNSASKVRTLIDEIQTKTEVAVQSMESSSTEIQEGTQLIYKVGTLFTTIQHAVQNLSTDIDDLSALSEQMSAGSEEVTASIQEIASMSVHSADSSSHVTVASDAQLATIAEIALATKALTNMSQELENNVNIFKV